MLKNYLQLVRFPGIFTAFSNVLLGFFVSQNINFDWILLVPLIISSGSMFLAGMALNDFFDFNEDIYNENVTVNLVERIRGEEKFSSAEELIEQMKKDKEIGLEILNKLVN